MKKKEEERSIEDYMKSVWASFEKFAERQAKVEIELAERDAKVKAELAEREAKVKAELEAREAKVKAETAEWNAKIKAETAEWNARLDAYFTKRQIDDEKRQADLDAYYAKRHIEEEKKQADLDAYFAKRQIDDEKSKAKFDAELTRLNEVMGNYANNIGSVTEEYFYNSFKAGKTNFFGEKFDEIEKNLKGIKKGFKDEYDILLINGSSIGIVEVKFKANNNDIPKVLRKAETFRVNFPDYQNHKVYLGLATMAFYEELEQTCQSNGIAMIKQVGDTLVIFDETLKAY